MRDNILLVVFITALILRAAPAALTATNMSTTGEPNGVLTLDEARATALARSPELGVFPYDLRAAEARVLQAGLRPNPQLEAEVEDVGGRRERRGFETAQTTVQISQPLELGGKRARRMGIASLDKELVQWDYQAARLDVIREAKQAFAAVLAAQERLALTDQLLELSRQAQAAVAQRVQAGKDSPTDELRADVAFSESRIERQTAENALRAARHRLAATWGGRAPAFEKVAGDFYQTPEPMPPAQIRDAVSANPDLARWRTEEDRRRAALRLEKARSVPDITVGAGVRHYEITDDAAMVFGLALPLPLFDRNQGGILEATAQLAKARRQSEAAQIKTLAGLSEATSTLATAYHEVITLEREVLPRVRRIFDAARQGHQEGKFDSLHLLEAQRTLFQTQAQYIDSIETYHRAWAEVERLIGGPLNTTNKNLSSTSAKEPLSQEHSHEK